jgi:hypothetical protein
MDMRGQTTMNTDIIDFGARELGVRPQSVARWIRAKDVKLSIAIKIAAVWKMDIGAFIHKYSDIKNAQWDYNE